MFIVFNAIGTLFALNLKFLLRLYSFNNFPVFRLLVWFQSYIIDKILPFFKSPCYLLVFHRLVSSYYFLFIFNLIYHSILEFYYFSCAFFTRLDFFNLLVWFIILLISFVFLHKLQKLGVTWKVRILPMVHLIYRHFEVWRESILNIYS